LHHVLVVLGSFSFGGWDMILGSFSLCSCRQGDSTSSPHVFVAGIIHLVLGNSVFTFQAY